VDLIRPASGWNLERLKLWLDALVSGDYEQGSGLLKGVDGRYCCLGVAAEVCEKNGGPKQSSMNVGFPDKQINDWFGDWLAGGFDTTAEAEEPGYTTPVAMNDQEGKSFRYIAAVMARKYGIEGFPFPQEVTDDAA
jgi:hypothetical protein